LKRNLLTIICLATILLVVCLAYLPGLRGPFVLDDAENISRDPSIAIKELSWEGIRNALGSDARGPLKRPLASLSFAMNYYWAGGFEATWPFKVTNLAIHAINTILVFGVALLLLSSPRLRETLTQSEKRAVALLGTALWAIHPIQLTNVLYVVQRMNSLATLFMLVGLILFMQGRLQLATSPKKALGYMGIGAIGGMALGLTAKENAALLPLYLLAIEYTLFSRDDMTRRTRAYLSGFYAFSFALPATVLVLYILTHPIFITDAFATRRFTAYERLLTETRILWYYVSLLLIPSTKRLSLFHDDIPLSHGIFDPFSTFVAASGIVIVLALSLLKTKRFPVAALAVLWFLVGQSMESTVLDLELVYEHRNYLPSLGPLLAFAYGLISMARHYPLSKAVWYGLPVALVGILGIGTWVRADSWKDIRTFATTEAQHHPASERANDFAARVSLIENHDVMGALPYTLRGLKAAPDEVGFLIDLQILLALVPAEYHSNMTALGISQELISPDRISAFLRTKPISVHGVISLENLQRCVAIPPHACNSLRDNAVQWLTISVDESPTSHTNRGILAASAARLLAYMGDYQRAYEYINRASAEFPYLVSYKLGKAEYLLKLGCREQAKFVLNQVEEMNQFEYAYNSVNRVSFNRLIEVYNASQKQGPDAARTKDLCYKLVREPLKIPLF
jgi:tetratricopeptide (TPR) repeat protein